MGTRALSGFVVNGQAKVTYSQFDGYPDGVGLDVLHFLQERLPVGYEDMVEQADNLVLIDEDSKPTPAQQQELARFANTGVSTGKLDEWYVLLRDTQGNLAATLEAGYMIDSFDFGLDSVFCEWGYVVDLDKRTLYVYEGFNQEMPTEGLWAHRPTMEEREESYKSHLEYAKAQKRDPWNSRDYFMDPEYFPIKLIASFEFADGLPDDETFLKQVTDASRNPDEEN